MLIALAVLPARAVLHAGGGIWRPPKGGSVNGELPVSQTIQDMIRCFLVRNLCMSLAMWGDQHERHDYFDCQPNGDN